MKKVLFTAALFSACTFVMAQEAPSTPSTPSTTSDYKPAAGANNLELNFTPLGNSPISITNIRYRRFLTETTALRLGVGVSIMSSSVEEVLPSNLTPGTFITGQKAKTSTFGWNIKPGYEKHFKGTNRLSPYIGGELDLASQMSKSVSHTIAANDVITETIVRNAGKNGFFRFGVNALAGFDCYLTKHLYLGAEMGFGLSTVLYSKVKTSSSPAPASPVRDVDQGNTFNLGPNFNSAIRLGFIF